MSRIPLTDAAKDSHRVTLGIHLAAAERCIEGNNWSAAKLALQLALPHANAIGDRELKKRVFGLLNVARAKAKAKAPEAFFFDKNGVQHTGTAEEMWKMMEDEKAA